MVAGIVLSLLAITFAVVWGRRTTRSSAFISSLASGDTYCYAPPTPGDWQDQARNGIVFGLDVVELSSNTAQVVVQSVTMRKPTGGVTLTSTSFVPSGTVSIGTPGVDGVQTNQPSLAKYARDLPAKLALFPRPSDVEAFGYHDTRWQLAVTLKVPASSSRSSTGNFVITYESDGSRHVLTTRDDVILGTAPGVCSSTK